MRALFEYSKELLNVCYVRLHHKNIRIYFEQWLDSNIERCILQEIFWLFFSFIHWLILSLIITFRYDNILYFIANVLYGERPSPVAFKIIMFTSSTIDPRINRHCAEERFCRTRTLFRTMLSSSTWSNISIYSAGIGTEFIRQNLRFRRSSHNRLGFILIYFLPLSHSQFWFHFGWFFKRIWWWARALKNKNNDFVEPLSFVRAKDF